MNGYNLTFQNLLFSSLPPLFATGFKALCASTLPSNSQPDASPKEKSQANYQMWSAFESLGLTDRFESILASVGYEHIETHVIETCKGKWGEQMLDRLRDWMSSKFVPWMLMVYARNAKNSECHVFLMEGEAKMYYSGRGEEYVAGCRFKI